MTHCKFCGKETGILPFHCNYCGGKFCSDHRLPENHECSFDKNYKLERLKEKNKLNKPLKKVKITYGTYFLMAGIIFMSVLGFYFPEYLNFQFFSINPWTGINAYAWTFFPSLLVVTITNIPELCYFAILMIFTYSFMQTFEKKYGFKMLFTAYMINALLVLFCYLALGYFMTDYWRVASYNSQIGLASGCIIGLIFSLLLEDIRRDWYLKRIKLKAWWILVFLIVFSIITKVYTILNVVPGYVYDYFYAYFFVYYMVDFNGINGGIAFSAWYHIHSMGYS